MAKAKMTLDRLAAMMARGFERTAVDLAAFQRVTNDQFRLVQADIKDIKATLAPLMGIVTRMDREVNDLRNRVEFIEQKVGILRKRN
jgi:phage shock protein A